MQQPQALGNEPASNRIFTVGTLVYTLSGVILLFCWLLFGDFALAMRDRSVGPLTEKFLLRYGADNNLKQILSLFLPTAIALVVSPIVSYKSDRYRSRWGRRTPFLLIPTPIAGLAMIGIAFSPQMGTALYTAMGNTPPPGTSLDAASGSTIIGVFSIFWTIFEVAVIVSASVFGGLINDVVPRPLMGRFFGLFRQISLFDGILFNAILFKHAEEHFTLMFALIGLLFGGGFTLMCLKVKEGTYPPPPQDDLQRIGTQTGAVAWVFAFLARFFGATLTYMRECFAQPYYLLCFAMLTLGVLTFRPINDFSIRYAAQLKMPDADYGNLVAFSYLVSLTVAFPLGTLVDRFHAIRLAIVSIALYAATAFYGAIFVNNSFSFGVALVAHTILSGTYFTCTASLMQALLPRSKFTQYASAGGIVSSVALLVFGLSSGRILDRLQNNYQLTFWAGLVFSILTLGVTLLVYRRFMALGGPADYVAPGDSAAGVRTARPAPIGRSIALYFAGAGVGSLVGYVLAFFVQFTHAGGTLLSLARFHEVILTDKGVRGVTMVCLGLCIIPGALIGVWAGSDRTPARAAH